jgi:hypothetical protein
MRSSFPRPHASGFLFLFPVLVSAAGLLLTGCGATLSDTVPTTHILPAFKGSAFGGSTPIVGAEVRIYATGNSSGNSTGYGVATLLQEATQTGLSAHQDTDGGGGFSFAGGYDCPAGQFAYLVSSGGSAGSYNANPNILEVAALGRCEDLFAFSGGNYTGWTGGFIYMNELTTVAAAYALGNFATVTGSGTGSAATVLIGAPATNNAAQVGGVSTGCVAGVGSCTTTAAAGLAHAFLNAANLVNVYGDTANATVPGNTNGIVPVQLINTIGNILVGCVNSAGGTAGDPSVCGKLFSATTIGSNTPPADSFSAMVNLAANPTLGGSTANVSNFFGLDSATTHVFEPELTSSTNLNDYSIAINYIGGSSGNTAITYPDSGALDINDVFYVGNTVGSGSGVLAFSSDGTFNGASGSNSDLENAFGLSVDALGNGYFGNGPGSHTNQLGVFTISGGVPATPTTVGGVGADYVYATAVDRANNAWFFGPSNSRSESVLVKSSAGAKSFTGFGTPAQNIAFASLAIDPDQNVWTTVNSSLFVLPNAGTVNTPSYNTTSNPLLTLTTTANPTTGIAFAGNSSSFTAYVGGEATDPGIQPFTPTLSGATVASVSAGSLSNPNSAIVSVYGIEVDGNGTIWIADGDVAIDQYRPVSSPTVFFLQPCGYIASNTCAVNGVLSYGFPTTISIDSAGSIWTSVRPGSYASVVQIIGSAAPTWPLLSLGVTGLP